MKYFIAYKLEGADAEVVEKLRQEIAANYDVHHALRIPPHLTLYYPFEMEEGRVSDLKKTLEEFAQQQLGFGFLTKGFASFGENVWYIDVEQAQQLIILKENLGKQMTQAMGLLEDTRGHDGVHFHVTLAYKDLTPEKFAAIGKFLATQKVPINYLSLNKITLFRFEQDRWMEEAVFPLGSQLPIE
jgi:2'-5' RNA ligase